MSPDLDYFLEKFELYLRRKDDGITPVTYEHVADCLLNARIATEKKLDEERRNPRREVFCVD